jgi:DNA-binding ferritin-like protein
MNIEIIKVNPIDNNLETTKKFGMFLNNILSSMKMLHWYTNNYNVHKILGKHYEKLSNLFDKLQEEIIGTSSGSNVLFPMVNTSTFELLDYSDFSNAYITIIEQFKNNTNSIEFNNYLNSVSSGINNTKEEIFSEINKTLYLLSLINS